MHNELVHYVSSTKRRELTSGFDVWPIKLYERHGWLFSDRKIGGEKESQKKKKSGREKRRKKKKRKQTRFRFHEVASTTVNVTYRPRRPSPPTDQSASVSYGRPVVECMEDAYVSINNFIVVVLYCPSLNVRTPLRRVCLYPATPPRTSFFAFRYGFLFAHAFFCRFTVHCTPPPRIHTLSSPLPFKKNSLYFRPWEYSSANRGFFFYFRFSWKNGEKLLV